MSLRHSPAVASRDGARPPAGWTPHDPEIPPQQSFRCHSLARRRRRVLSTASPGSVCRLPVRRRQCVDRAHAPHVGPSIRAYPGATRLPLRPGSTSAPTSIPIALAANHCPTARDFVPWRFSDAGQIRAWSSTPSRRPRNLHKGRRNRPRGRTASLNQKTTC